MGDEAILGLCNRLMKSRDSVHSIREIKTGKHRSAITVCETMMSTFIVNVQDLASLG